MSKRLKFNNKDTITESIRALKSVSGNEILSIRRKHSKLFKEMKTYASLLVHQRNVQT